MLLFKVRERGDGRVALNLCGLRGHPDVMRDPASLLNGRRAGTLVFWGWGVFIYSASQNCRATNANCRDERGDIVIEEEGYKETSSLKAQYPKEKIRPTLPARNNRWYQYRGVAMNMDGSQSGHVHYQCVQRPFMYQQGVERAEQGQEKGG